MRFREGLHFDAEPAAHDIAVVDDLLHDAVGERRGDGKADPLGAAGVGVDRGIDADELAIGVDEGTPGVTWIDGRVGLDEILEGIEADMAAAGGADDAHGDGLTDTEGIADGEHHVAHPGPAGLVDGNRREVGQLYLEHRQIGVRIRPEHGGTRFAAVLEHDPDLVGATDQVMIGDDVSLGAHDHAGAAAAGDLPR